MNRSANKCCLGRVNITLLLAALESIFAGQNSVIKVISK